MKDDDKYCGNGHRKNKVNWSEKRKVCLECQRQRSRRYRQRKSLPY